MNKVVIELEAPESVWVRGDCQVTDEGFMQYEARFCRTGFSTKPVHMGPVFTLRVRNAKGEEISSRSATVVVKSSGDMALQYYKEVPSELEKGAPLPKEAD